MGLNWMGREGDGIEVQEMGGGYGKDLLDGMTSLFLRWCRRKFRKFRKAIEM